MQPYELTIAAAADRLQRGALSALELTRSVLKRIEAVDARVGAYLTVDREGALAQARHADDMRAAGQATVLTGIPLSIKDVICTRGLRTTCASRLLDNFIPPYDAAVMERLHQAGAVILGKTNMDEFAMGSSTENSGFHATRNPWNLDCIPGGSSGGSAAAVAADMCLGSLGSDTGGSIRQPASHCGIVGLKPTYGRVSRYGLVAFASSLDQIGPLGKTVRDCALLMNAISGHDARDSTSASQPVPDFTDLDAGGLQGLRIGLPIEYHAAAGLHPDVRRAVAAAVKTVEGLGAETVEISLPHTEYGVAAYYIIAPSEASSNLARYDGVRFGVRSRDHTDMIDMFRRTRSAGFGAEVQRRIILGQSGAHPDRRGFHQGLCALRCHPLARGALAGVCHRRENRRPPHDVPVRRVHPVRQPGRYPGNIGALRVLIGGVAHWVADHGAALRRGPAAPGGVQFRAGHGFSSGQTGLMIFLTWFSAPVVMAPRR
mgnify:CR=1 FL=1